MKNRWSIIFGMILTLSLTTCQSSLKYDHFPRGMLAEVPIVTGIWWTEVYSDYYNRKFGDPAYPIGEGKYARINVFPNPYLGYNPEELDPDVMMITFTRLPRKVEVDIYRAVWVGQKSDGEVKGFTGSLAAHPILPVVTLKKDSPSQYFSWNFRDKLGNLLPSGFYRAFFFVDGDSLINFVDMYVITRFDCSTWIDPTGFLPEDWDKVYLENGDVLSICDPEFRGRFNQVISLRGNKKARDELPF
ncbi:MAG: hypothetical protein D6732_08450 [Methanobacteriota archaeon]|nr:MAG: hypothetical protein D6732_08450 [Euryarchaeota archaeon]